VRKPRVKTPRPAPPPPGAAYTAIPGIAGLLEVSLRKALELRRDPTFPPGRLFGGRGALRFSVAAVLRWAERQPEARFSSRGGARQFEVARD